MEETKKMSFGRRMLIFFVGILAFIGLFSAILCAVNPLISPNFFVVSSYFGLGFWVIILFNLFIFIVLIILKAKKIKFVPILSLIIAVPGFMNSYSVKKQSTDEGYIKIMTYNVCQFSDVTTKDKKIAKSEIIEIIKSQNPDIVCLQESGSWNDKISKDFAEKINCKYYAFNKNHYGNVMFSKYPFYDDEYTDKCNSNTEYLVRGVNAGGLGKFYVECVHLQSFMITDNEIDYINDARIYDRKSDTIGKSVIYKLKEGFIKRTKDVSVLVDNLPEYDVPIVVCGDFNDTPLSYTYHRMRKANLNDAFLKVGHGIGKTYCGRLPLLRIDYFWHNEQIVPMTYERVKQKLSDHYPITMTFNVIH